LASNLAQRPFFLRCVFAAAHVHPMSHRRSFLLVALVLPSIAAAESASAPELSSSVVQMLLGLGVVLLLVFASLYLLKRLAAPRGGAAGLLRVVAATAIGPRERVVVLEIGDTWLVLGTAPGSVTQLSQLPRRDLPATNSVAGKDFAGWLKQITDRRNGR